MLWTFQPKREQSIYKHLPFITWPVQDEAIDEIIARIRNGGDLLIDKSREMGATWIILGCYMAEWLLVPDSTFLVISRKEEYVYKKGNPDTLFWKLQYMYKNLPLWVQPPVHDAERHLQNLRNNSVIDGESTNSDVGAGGRRQSVMCDEFARVKRSDAETIEETLSDTTPNRLFNSTPQSRKHPFGQIRFGGKVKVFILPWWRHPWKAQGLYESPDLNHIRLLDYDFYVGRWPEIFKKYKKCEKIKYSELEKDIMVTVTKKPKCFDHVQDKSRNLRALHFIADGNDPANEDYYSPHGYRSPWYDNECERRGRRDKATNLDMNHIGSGDVVFNPSVLLRMLERVARKPDYIGEVEYDVRGDLVENVRFIADHKKCRLKWWQPLAGERPDQSHNYIIGCDIAMGTGQSNSVASIYDVNLNMKVGRWSCPNTSPTHFAEQVTALGKWIGGVSGVPFLIWESNGPGQIFDRRLYAIGYDYVYKTTDEMKTSRKRRRTRGWHSGRDSKMLLLDEYNAAMEAHFRPKMDNLAYINPDKESLHEAEDYVFYKSGAIGPASSEEDEGGAKAAHGDMVIADALTCLARVDQPKTEIIYSPNSNYGSFLERRKKAIRERQKTEREQKWLI